MSYNDSILMAGDFQSVQFCFVFLFCTKVNVQIEHGQGYQWAETAKLEALVSAKKLDCKVQLKDVPIFEN